LIYKGITIRATVVCIFEVCLPATISNEVFAHVLEIVGILENKC